MSSALALASITCLLKHELQNGLALEGLSDSLGSSSAVTALPPDHISTGSDELPRLNLFLYQVTPQSIYRIKGSGRTPPLALALYYLISAYGATELHTELLLGSAIRVLGGERVFTPDQIQRTLASLSADESSREVAATVAAVASASQVQRFHELKVEPQFLSLDEVSKIWSSLQARYRPSVAYKASLVLIQPIDSEPAALARGR